MAAMASLESQAPPAVTTPPPWYAAYPAPKSQPAGMTREAVLGMMKDSVAGKDYVLVDLRRADHDVRVASPPLLQTDG